MKVAVIGAKGKMGRECVAAISATKDLELVSQIDLGDDISSIKGAGAQVIVDFTNPDSVMKNLEFAISNGINAVIGTTGFNEEKLEKVKKLLSANPKVAVLIAPNFGIGAILMMQFAKQAAAHFDSAEIMEFHHASKADAPSGTAARTAELISNVRKSKQKKAMPDGTKTALPGARGAKVGDVSIHSIRSDGYVAHQEVVFGSSGETLTIRHDSIDRAGYMPGVLLGIREVAKHPGLTIGLENFIQEFK
jgi:4-hydroxy-tetrahydrodipicolinate reductase